MKVQVLEVQFKTQEQSEELSPRSLSLATSLRGTMMLNAKLKSMKSKHA